jgi:hypothetical protein
MLFPGHVCPRPAVLEKRLAGRLSNGVVAAPAGKPVPRLYRNWICMEASPLRRPAPALHDGWLQPEQRIGAQLRLALQPAGGLGWHAVLCHRSDAGLFWLGTFFKNRFVPHTWEADIDATPAADPEVPFPWKKAAVAWLCFMLLVAAIPIAERFIPARYPPGAAQAALATLISETSDKALDAPALQRFLKDEKAVALAGRAMYPRYYKAGDGIPRRGWPSYAVREYPRLGFVLVGSDTIPVVLPQAAPPADFPNAADVLVLGCKGEDYIDARLVMLLKHPATVLLPSSSPALDCASP